MKCFYHLLRSREILFIENKRTKTVVPPMVIIEDDYIHRDFQGALFSHHPHQFGFGAIAVTSLHISQRPARIHRRFAGILAPRFGDAIYSHGFLED